MLRQQEQEQSELEQEQKARQQNGFADTMSFGNTKLIESFSTTALQVP